MLIVADSMYCEFRLILYIILIQCCVVHLIQDDNHQISEGMMYLKLLITFMYKRLYKFYISCWTSNYGWGKSLTALKHQLHRRATTPEGPSNINWSKKLTKNERFVWFSLLIFVVLLDLFWAKKLTKNEPFVWLRLLIFVVLLDLFWSKKLTKPSSKWESLGLNTDRSSS